MTSPNLDQTLADLTFQVTRLQSGLSELEHQLSDLKRRVDIAETPRDVRYLPTGIPGVGIIRDRSRVGIHRR